MRLANENRAMIEAEKDKLDRELAARADMERAKLEHVKRDMMDILARQNRAATDPMLHQKFSELDSRETELRNLKIELAQERQNNEVFHQPLLIESVPRLRNYHYRF